MRTVFVAVAAALALLVAGGAVRAQTPPPAGDDLGPAPELQDEYRTVVAQGVAEFGAGHWAEARAAFTRAHELWPSARTLRSLGMTSFELRAYARAARELQAALDDTRRPLSAEQRAHVTALLSQTQAFVGRYRVTLSPPDAQLLVDGAEQAQGEPRVLVLETGRHELVARAAGHEVLRRTLNVQGREDRELVLALQPSDAVADPGGAPPAAATPAAPPAGPSMATPSEGPEERGGLLWTWVAGGAAVGLAIASTAFWLHSRAEYDPIDAECAKVQCVEGELDESPFSTPETLHHVTLGLALAAGAGAVVLFFVEGDEGPGERAPVTGTTQVTIGLGAAGVRGTF